MAFVLLLFVLHLSSLVRREDYASLYCSISWVSSVKFYNWSFLLYRCLLYWRALKTHHIFFKKYSPEKIYEYKNNVRNIGLLHRLSLVAPNHPIMSPVYVPRATRARNQFDHFVHGLLIFIEWSIHEVDIWNRGLKVLCDFLFLRIPFIMPRLNPDSRGQIIGLLQANVSQRRLARQFNVS